MAKTWDYKRGQWKEEEPKPPSSVDILYGRAKPSETRGGPPQVSQLWDKAKDVGKSVAGAFSVGRGDPEPKASIQDKYYSSDIDEAGSAFASQQQARPSTTMLGVGKGRITGDIFRGEDEDTSTSFETPSGGEGSGLEGSGQETGLTPEQLESLEREQAEQAEQDRVLGMVNTMFGTDAGMGYGRGIVQGDLRKQIEQFGQLEGEMRGGYAYYNNDASGGMPLSTREAYTFLGQAQGRDANRIVEREVSAAMYDAVVNKLHTPGQTLTAGEQAVMDAYTTGQPVYTLDGRPATFEEIFEYSQIQDFRAESMALIDNYRINKEALLQKKIEQDYKEELAKAEQDSRERIARLEREQREAIAKQDRESALEIATEKRGSDLEIATERRASDLEIAQEQRTSDLEIAQERRESDLEIAKDTAKIVATGKEERLTQKERLDAEKAMATEELNARKHIAINEMNNQLAIVTREANAQSNLLYTQNTLETERINAQNEWQSLENDKLHFLENKRIDEAIASNQAQEELAREQQQIERESQKLNLIMSISQNPALLFFMNQSGMLTAPGETIMGEDVNDMISELTASIDPANMPNIQTYNALGEQEQARVRFRQAATRGVSPEGLENFLTGASPFTRGRKSTIKVGRA